MGKENLFCAWRLILVCFVYFHNVSSRTVIDEDGKKKETLIDSIRFCDTVFVIANSSYIKTCDTFNYPKEFLPDDTSLALCMLVYDTTNKICEYSSKIPVTSSTTTPLTLPESSQKLDKEIEKFESFNNRSDICKNISSIFNKLNHSKIEGDKNLIPYLKHSQNKLLSNDQCNYTCHITDGHKINHLCAYLLWVNEFFSLLKPIKDESSEGNLPGKENLTNAKAAVLEEKHENNSEQQDPQVIDKNEPKKIDKSPNTVSESENQQQSKPKLPANFNKKSDDVPKNPINDINTSINEPKNNPSGVKQVDESNNHGSLPAPPPKEEDAADVVESKKNDGDVDNAHQLPPDDANPEADSVSVEDHQNKKENDDPEEGIDRENVDIDQKESNNPGVDIPMKSPDDNDEFQQRQKFISDSQNLKAEEESHFFTYFSIFSLFSILLYFGYHNKQKIFAIFLEGRRSRRGRGSRRRPSTASYRKLDCNLEEAVTSQCNSNVTHVIY